MIWVVTCTTADAAEALSLDGVVEVVEDPVLDSRRFAVVSLGVESLLRSWASARSWPPRMNNVNATASRHKKTVVPMMHAQVPRPSSNAISMFQTKRKRAGCDGFSTWQPRGMKWPFLVYLLCPFKQSRFRFFFRWVPFWLLIPIGSSLDGVGACSTAVVPLPSSPS